MSETNGMNRRRFLKNSAVGMGAVGAGLLEIAGGNPLNAQEKINRQQPDTKNTAPLKIKEYRTLGRTGFKVSDVSSGYVKDPAVLEQLLDAGVNYIDTAESYGNEPVVGSVIKKRDRKSVFITSKMWIDPKKTIGKEEFLSRFHKCQERLQTDYIDCMMIHGPESVKIIKTEGFHAAMKQLKSEGRLRFVGISNHGSNWHKDPEDTMEKVLLAAADDGRFDVMLLAYNFIQEDNGAKVLKVCREKNIGTTLMKVNPIGNIPRIKERIEKAKQEGKEVDKRFLAMIARLEEKEKKAQGFIKKYGLDNAKKMREASIRFVLSNPDVNTVCCAFRSFDDLDAYIPLSGTRITDMEGKKLAAYKEGCGSLYCRHACGLCEPACPHRVPVNTIMRYNHYFEAQGKEKFAMKSYAKLTGTKAHRCAGCSGFCEAACPYDVPVQGLLTLAHQTLSLA